MSNYNLLGILHATVLMFFGVCLSIFCPSSDVYAKDTQNTHVLVLNSYEKGFLWTDNIVKGIESVLKKEHDIDLKVEYMHSKAVKYDSAYQKKLFDLYAYRYKNQKFNVIITSDDNAFNFVREYHEDIFPDANVVFSGVNNIKAPDIVNRKLFTGILETTSEKETIDLALALHPGTKRIVVIVGTTPSGNYRWKQLEKSFRYFPEIEFIRFDDNYYISEIEDKMKDLTDETVAIFATLYRDRSGRYISLKEGASRISKASKQPIYTFHLQVLKYGTIGGKLLGGEHHGKMAAEMALKIIQGEKAQNIPIVKESLSEYIFDHSQLKRFNIQESALPANSIIKNRPFSFYEEYKVMVWTIGLFVFMLIIIIVALQMNIVKRKQAEAKIKEFNLILEQRIKDRKKIEQELKESLREKVLLLSEIHHRVKNNMQIISSLLNLQSDQIKDKQYTDIFNDSRSRIKSMALVHEKLYRSEDMANIDFNDYIQSLVNSLILFYEMNTGNIYLNVNAEDVSLGIDTAIPCGLVINELISNSLKHAFPESRKGEITVSFHKASVEGVSEYDLIVSDNGIGMPEGLDIRKTKSLGLQLVMTLIEDQLRGTIDLDRTNGTRFHIRFREICYEKRI